ncbi:hypothetical protein [Neisseria sp.]|uniref:hypothetical protein n=1 Tax=Neisseria sp. TaxID=192066 RepID=UPI0026DC4B4D|nr:hypothetical protein [Neisseria sp.]MDO4906999.1 hypothetical protein [Neisseria sp.]
MIKDIFKVIWLIKEEYLEFVRNFSPLIVLLSLFTVILFQMERQYSGWDNLQIVLTALPFGLLFLYAALTCVAVFYRKSVQKINAEAVAHIRRLRRRKQYGQARAYAVKVRRRFYAALLVVVVTACLGVSGIMLMAYSAAVSFYGNISE